MTAASVILARVELAGLADLVAQYADLLEQADDADPAVQRLAPDAYPDDASASNEFRRLTDADLLARRRSDAALVAATLDAPDGGPGNTVDLRLDEAEAEAWLRTLAGLRLVIAARLDIAGDVDDEHDPEDPRFGVYDWIGYRLELLVQALDDA